MAAIDWPNNIPDKPLVDSFAETPPRDVVRTQMDAGPAKMRPRSTSGVRNLNVTFMMNETELSNLDTFYETTTSQGTARFDFSHPRTGTTVEMRFVERPTYRLVSDDDYEVRVKFEVLP